MDRTYDILIRKEDEEKTKDILAEFKNAADINWWRFGIWDDNTYMCTFSYVLSDDIPDIINKLKENGIQVN